MAKHSSTRRMKRVASSSDCNKDNRYNRDGQLKKQIRESKDSRKMYSNSKSDLRRQFLRSLMVIVLAIVFAFLNSYHQSSMFENDRHFSHLSTLEREMTFRTEMGLYYSYFKTIIEAPSLLLGINQIMNDNLTEYPTVINTLQRFNLYPEVLLGASYRCFQGIAQFINAETKQCWKVLRGDNLSPVESCEGLGDPTYFYTTSVFLLNGLVGALMFLYGIFLSNSVFGGLISAACFFFNHGECTRVQWTPPLRESFGYPIFLLQMLVVTVIIRNQKPKFEEWLISGILTAVFILFWQFAQFALLTQTLAVFFTYLMNSIPASTLQTVLKGQMFGLLVGFCFLFGNKMLLTSFFAPTLVTVYVISILEMYFKKLNSRLLTMLIQLIILVLGILALKAALSLIMDVDDDAHIWKILKSKFTSYRDFHTMLYTCANEFDFMQFETPLQLSKTLLLPLVIVIIGIFSVQILLKVKNLGLMSLHEDATVLYNVLQMLAFFLMAVLVMRLKLFFTPHLCILASLIVSRKYFSYVSKPELQYAAVAVLLSLMAVQGIQNIQHQRSIVGEFSNPHLEKLIMWINSSTTPDAVFGGPMPTMANLLLSTRRPIVNHPHYENAALRNRTYQVYKIFSRKPAFEVYNILREMKVNFIVIEKHWCFGKSREGCGMADLWDIEDHENLGIEPLCQRLVREPFPFHLVFQNLFYTVLAL